MSKKNRNHGTISFAELRTKEVVNCIDGKRLGRIIDIVFGAKDGLILGIVVPPVRRNIIFRNGEPIFISWEYVEKIGEDILLVRIVPEGCWPHRPHRHGNALVASANVPKPNIVDDVEVSSLGASLVDSNDQSQNSVPVMEHGAYQNDIGNNKSNLYNGRGNSYRSNSEQDIKEGYSNNTGTQRSKGISIVTKPKQTVEPFRPGIDCDNNCSKCMLFDCSYRWNSED